MSNIDSFKEVMNEQEHRADVALRWDEVNACLSQVNGIVFPTACETCVHLLLAFGSYCIERYVTLSQSLFSLLICAC